MRARSKSRPVYEHACSSERVQSDVLAHLYMRNVDGKNDQRETQELKKENISCYGPSYVPSYHQGTVAKLVMMVNW